MKKHITVLHAFMNIIRLRTYEKYPKANITYGNYNDAIAITGIKSIKENQGTVFKIKQFRIY